MRTVLYTEIQAYSLYRRSAAIRKLTTFALSAQRLGTFDLMAQIDLCFDLEKYTIGQGKLGNIVMLSLLD